MRRSITAAALVMLANNSALPALAADATSPRTQAYELERSGHPDQAIPIRRDLLDMAITNTGPLSADTAMAHSFLAADLQYASAVLKADTPDAGYLREAEQHWRAAIDIHRHIEGEEGPQSARTHMELAVNLMMQRREAEAKQESELASAMAKKLEEKLGQ